MADYSITAVDRRTVLSGSAGTGPYAFNFPVLTETDLAVYQDDTKLTLTTDYTVSIGALGTGSVTLVVAATASNNITIVGARAIERTTDFVTAGDLLASSLNTELDSLTIFSQQVSEDADRAIKAPVTDPTSIDMTLPTKASRAGKTLAFDETTGNPVVGEEIGNYRGDWAAGTSYSVRDLVKDTSTNNIFRAKTAHTSSGSQPLTTNTDSAKWDLIVDAAAASTSAAAAAASATAAAASETAAASSSSSASSSASAASTSATSAASSSTSASGFADEAENWARKVDGIVESTDYSSKAWAIGGTGVTDTASAGAAKEWATETSGTVDTSEYSAKEYASGTQSGTGGSAKSWAQTAEDTAVTGSSYSALHHAAKAAASATAAAASAASAAGNAGTQSVDRFNGDGSTTAFTMTSNPATENNTMVYVSGVYQQKDTYSTSGTTLTFSTAPPTGTGNIEVMHMSTLPTGVSPTIGTVTTGAAGSSASVTATGHVLDFTIPKGDTGATGSTGPAATIAVGTVTTGSPGSSATVTNSGTSGAAVFDFSIPQGDAGSVAGMADGTAAAPSLAFSGDTDTGLFRVGADTVGFTTGGSERLRIDSAGHVAVGTTTTGNTSFTIATNSSGVTPNTTGDDLFIESSGNTGMTIGSGTANQGRIYFADSGNAIAGRVGYDHTDDSMYFGTNGVNERMTLDSTGQLGIGVSPSYDLHVSGDIYATGDVTAFSSAVAKDEITTIPDALDLVEQLRGVSFKWKESGKKAVGLIYEEVKEVIPELTSEKEGHVGVQYQNTVAVLIEAVKTLSARVKELEDK